MALLMLENICKSFPGVKALQNINLEINSGEILGLVGENGAGKSTLMKILSGVYQRDSGTISFCGKQVEISSPLEAQQLGISIIFQEFNLIHPLSIAENIFAGRLFKKNKVTVDWKKVYSETSRILEEVGIKLSPYTKIEQLSVAQMQMVEIAKALSFDSKLIIMDEPSATLTDNEIDNLFTIIGKLKAEGKAVIYISHRLDEIFHICDKVVVLRDGEVIKTGGIQDFSRQSIVSYMVGRKMDQEFPQKSSMPTEKPVLEVEKLTSQGRFDDISFVLKKGEILGFAGLVGSGRTEIMRAVFGADKYQSGTIKLFGKDRKNGFSPRKSINEGIAFLTENRKEEGLILQDVLKKQITIANLKDVEVVGYINDRKEEKIAEKYVKLLDIKTPSVNQVVNFLSGGNQQKVIIGKWLFTKAKIFILDEPTRGIDVGAKFEIYQLINQLAKQGISIIIISSEMQEIVALCDRVVVVHEGRKKGELSGVEITPNNVMALAIS